MSAKKPAFTVREVFAESYAIIKPKFWLVVGQFALLFVICMLFSYSFRHIVLLRAIVTLLYSFFATVFGLSYMQKGSFSLDDISRALTLRRFCYFALSALIFFMAVVAGLIILVIPGIIFALNFYLYKYLTIDMNLGPLRAFEESIRLTKGSRLRILWFGIVAGLITLAGFACLFIGLFFTMPLVMIASALVYKKLSQKAGMKDEEPSDVGGGNTEIVDAVIVETPEPAQA